MNANRVGGPASPEPGKGQNNDSKLQSGRRPVEKVEKIKKVGEVDPDQSRAKRFRQALDDAEEQFQNAKKSKGAPSPFETSFHQEERNPPVLRSSSSSERSQENRAIPSPDRSSPPDVRRRETSRESEPNPLPKSKKFWKDSDEPPNGPPSSRKYEEGTGADKDKKKGESVEGLFLSKDLSPFGAKAQGKGEKEEEEEDGLFISDDDMEEPLEAEKRAKGAPKMEFPPLDEKPKTKEGKKNKQDPFSADIAPIHQDKDKKEEKDRDPEKAPLQIQSPSNSQLSPQAASFAQAAANTAMPYLNPQVLPLFYQMVGTIYMMASTSGISQTEIVLNSPSFRNSIFFGSTIVIEKYATAPDSLNIRLSGSNQAVNLFNQNIPNLMAAFQNGNFGFKVNRIDAAYATDKPVFRRKEKGDSKGDQSMDMDSDPRK